MRNAVLRKQLRPPAQCAICEDERQFVRHQGQQWTTLGKVKDRSTTTGLRRRAALLGIGTEPEFAIGQRALSATIAHGNLLWDCISLLDDKTVAEVKARGGIPRDRYFASALYSSMIEWAECFDAADIPARGRSTMDHA